MISLKELENYLKELLNISLVADYSVNGLQIDGKKEIKKIATAVSASLETIEAAITHQADALIVHHGLFWQGDSYVISGPKYKKIQSLIANKLSLLAYHLPLDIHHELGNNWKAAKDLGWTDLEPFGMHRGVAIGVKGRFPKMARETFQAQLEEYYQHHSIHALGGQEQVCSAGLISGGAYKNLSEAASEGLDCFVTGNFDEPAWYQAKEESINFFALGHTATEKIGPKALGSHLAVKFGLKEVFLDIENPF